MFGWSVVFLVGALLAALFAFGAVTTPYQSIAWFAFYGLLGLAALAFIAGFFVRKHDSATLSSSGRTMALCAILTGAGFVGYLWVTEGWTADQVARALSQSVAQMSASAQTFADNH